MFNGDVLARLDVIERKLDRYSMILFKWETQMAGELDALKTQVAQTNTVQQSAIVLLQGLKQKLDAAIAGGNPADLTALSQSLGTQSQALADAITANTPAATP